MHGKSYKNHNHTELETPEKFEAFLKKETAETEKVDWNILQHSLSKKSLQSPFIVDFKKIIVETDNQSKLRVEKIRMNYNNWWAYTNMVSIGCLSFKRYRGWKWIFFLYCRRLCGWFCWKDRWNLNQFDNFSEKKMLPMRNDVKISRGIQKLVYWFGHSNLVPQKAF